MRFLLTLVAILWAASATAQQLPAPQFRTPAANDNSAKAATTSFVQGALTSLKGASSTWTGSNTYQGPFALSRTISYSGGVSPANSSVYNYVNLSGSSPAGNLYLTPNPTIIQDTSSFANAGGAIVGSLTQHNVNAGGGRGIRSATAAELFFKGSTGSGLGDSALQFYHGGFFKTYVQANDGGDASNKRGSFFGLAGLVGSDCQTACHLNGLSNELNVYANENTTLNYKFGLTIISVNGDATPASGQEAMLMMTRDVTTKIGWKKGIALGFYDGYWPIDPAQGTIIGTAASKTVSEAGGTAYTVGALYGVDFSAVTFASGGAAFKSNGFSVGPVGQVNAATFNSPGFQVNGSGVVTIASSPNAVAKSVCADSFNQLIVKPGANCF